MNITFSTRHEDSDFLTAKINEETSEMGVPSPFGFFIKDEKEEIIAGCNGLVIYGEIYTYQLWTHSAYRHQGLGRKLLEQVHSHGRNNQCTISVLQTMTFQNAVTFYEKLGYTQDFKRDGYVNNSSCLFMKKEL
jgi:ribosomal protein S18 acetylase RimI-like enzyme